MPKVQIGQQVMVNLAGLKTPAAKIAGGVSAGGVITRIDAQNGLITVKLHVALGGQNTVMVTPDRVSVVD